MLEAEAHTLAAELEQVVIDAEVELGLSVPQAIRPLFEHELKATTRFADLQDLTETASDQAETILSKLWAIIRDAILDLLFGEDTSIRPAQLVDRITDLEQPDTYRAVVEESVEQLAELYAGVYGASSRILIEEAVRQGVAGIEPLTVEADRFEPLATVPAQEPWNRTLTRIRNTHATPAAMVQETIERDDVAQTIDDTEPDGASDLAHQGVLVSQGMGRGDTADELPEPDQIFSSELMDGRTCPECAAIDGTDYQSIDEAKLDYPNAGAYARCRGGARCRGTLSYIWND